MSKEKTLKLIQYILLIVIGILFACSIAEVKIIQYCIGAGLLVYGLFLLIKCVYTTKSLVLVEGISGALLIALGAGTLSNYIPLVGFGESAIAVIIAAVGSLFILDSIIKFVGKKNSMAIAELVVGLVLLALGLMLALWSDFKQFLWVIFGVLLAVYGIYAIVILLTNSKSKVVKK